MEKIGENSSQVIITAAAKGEEKHFGTAPVDAISTIIPEMIESTSSSQTKSTVIFILNITMVL